MQPTHKVREITSENFLYNKPKPVWFLGLNNQLLLSKSIQKFAQFITVHIVIHPANNSKRHLGFSIRFDGKVLLPDMSFFDAFFQSALPNPIDEAFIVLN